MQFSRGEARLNVIERGTGMPMVVLHGAGVDHREIEAALEASGRDDRVRSVYIDLPGMGESVADGLQSNADVVELLIAFTEQELGPSLLLGHSFGAFFARAMAASRPELVRGLALICPFGGDGPTPRQTAVVQDADAYDDLDVELRQAFDDYFVVRTGAMAQRFRDAVVPGQKLVDKGSLERIFANWEVDLGSEPLDVPTLIVGGRHDSTVGWRAPMQLAEVYPRATTAVLENAGHALMHEQPDILRALLTDWIDRATTA